MDTTTALATVRPVTPPGMAFSLIPTSFGELERIATILSKSEIIPACFKDKPYDVMIAMELLRSVGVNPVAGLQGVAVINKRVSMYGEWWRGLIQSSAVYEAGPKQDWDPETETATVTYWRKGAPHPYIGSFSKKQAQEAGLLVKDTYKGYLRDMLTWRAEHRAGSAAFSDILHGFIPAEVADDYETVLDETPGRPEVQMPVRKSETAAPAETPKAEEPLPPTRADELFPEPTRPETHLVADAVVEARSPKGSTYAIKLGDEKWFSTKDPAIYRAAVEAKDSGKPVKVMFVGNEITLIAKAEG